jgi:uncharacterized protein (DUF885 family)
MSVNSLSRWIAALLMALLLGACEPASDSVSEQAAQTAAETEVAKDPLAGDSVTTSEDDRLLAFFDQVFERNVSQSPDFQARLGRKTEDYGKWDDYSDEHAVEINQQATEDLQRLRSDFDFSELSPSAQLSYRIFEYNREREIRAFPWRHHDYAVSQMNNVAAEIPTFLQNLHKVETRQDAEDYISRLQGVETVMQQHVELLRTGEALGIVPPKLVYDRALPAVRNMLQGAPFEETAEDGIVLGDFHAKLDALDISEEDRSILLNQAANALSGPFRVGYQALGAELKRLQAVSLDNHGVWALPDGEQYYANRIEYWTTLAIPPDEVHQLGLSEVARIRAEMEQIKEEVGFDGDLMAFFEYVRTNPENYYPNTAEGRADYLRDATALIDGIYDIADDYFNVLPKAPLEVRRVEPWRENGSSTAFYNRPAPDGSRPGIFYVNLQNMNAVQKHIMNSLAYHEGAPGHHFQLAIQQELDGVPEFRKHEGYSAYWEGWALYSERVAFEAGLYEGLPMRNFGRLSEEMKRAVRLVVDTGMHAKRWTREECIAYMTANTPMAPADIERQIERYFVYPGQALSYKMGMQAILQQRERLQGARGQQFDIREFHDLVLKNGAMPLDVFAQLIDDAIARPPSEENGSL